MLAEQLSKIFVIAKLSFLENYKKKIFYLVAFLGILLILFLSSFSLYGVPPQPKIIIDLGISIIGLFLLFLSISLTLTILQNEIEKKTIYPLLAKPLSRFHYIWGRFLGVYFIVFITWLILITVLIVGIYFITHQFYLLLIPTGILLLIEVGIVQSIVLLLTIFTTPPVALSLAIFLYTVAEVSNVYAVVLAKVNPLGYIIYFMKYLLPNLDYFHIKNALIYEMNVSFTYILLVFLYGILYIIFINILSGYLFSKKDL